MKEIVILLVSALTFLSSCNKPSQSEEIDLDDEVKNEVIINGHTYLTIDIGSQTWLKSGYYGGKSSGISVEKGAKYQRNQMEDIIPPKGWRIPKKADAEQLFRAVGVKGDYEPLEETYWEHLEPFEGSTTDKGFQLIMPHEIAITFLGGYEWKNVPLNIGEGFNAQPLSNQTSEWWCDEKGMCTFVFSVESDGRVSGKIKYLPDINTHGSKYQYKTCGVRFVKDR